MKKCYICRRNKTIDIPATGSISIEGFRVYLCEGHLNHGENWNGLLWWFIKK